MGWKRRGENIAGVGINNNVQLSPRAALVWTGTWNVTAMDAKTGAVGYNVHGSGVRGRRHPNIETLRMSGQGSVVGDANRRRSAPRPIDWRKGDISDPLPVEE